MNAADERHAAVARLIASRAAQNLPPRVEDPATVERIAAILRPSLLKSRTDARRAS